jgi:hypothetical protein
MMAMNIDHDMPSPPPSPPRPPVAKEPYISPRTLPYSEAFENSLMNLILHGTTPAPSASTDTLPDATDSGGVGEAVPLGSSMRTYEPENEAYRNLGIKLTHPGGSYTGGPGPGPAYVESPSEGQVDEEQREFVLEFLKRNNVKTEAQLKKAVNDEIERKIKEIRERMRQREEALKNNEKVQNELKNLVDGVERERKIAEQMRKG